VPGCFADTAGLFAARRSGVRRLLVLTLSRCLEAVDSGGWKRHGAATKVGTPYLLVGSAGGAGATGHRHFPK